MNKIYYDVFKTETHLAYHVSSCKEDVINRKAMSRRTTIDNPNAGALVLNWFNDAALYRAARVESVGDE